MDWILKQYQRWISPFLPRACRFYPSCSEYARQCFRSYNIFVALFYTTKRMLRCHPYCEGGIDPIP